MFYVLHVKKMRKKRSHERRFSIAQLAVKTSMAFYIIIINTSIAKGSNYRVNQAWPEIFLGKFYRLPMKPIQSEIN